MKGKSYLWLEVLKRRESQCLWESCRGDQASDEGKDSKSIKVTITLEAFCLWQSSPSKSSTSHTPRANPLPFPDPVTLEGHSRSRVSMTLTR